MSDRVRSTSPVRATAPALQCRSVEHRAGVLRTSCDCKSGATSSKIDGWKHVPHFSGIVPLIVCIAVTKSPIRAIAPTFDSRIVEDRTCMCRTCTDGHRSSSSSEIYRCGRRNCRSDSIANVNRVVRSQTTVSCRAPALHRPIVENHARMKVACSKCRCAATASKRNWRGVGNCRRRAAIGNVDH